ncbi:MAG TPA: DUF5668 domain-containing protein [Methylomirabilota bacterium]|nr:DUF5668 domain-containing protein [Methylomirabilota bacterium]
MSGDPGDDPGLPRGVMTERPGPRLTGRLVFGLVLVACGLMWTLQNLGVPGVDEFLRWWPAALVVYGLVRLTGLDGTRRVASGAIVTLIGAWLLGREFGIIHISIFRLWPVWMVVVGSVLVWRSMRGPGIEHDSSDRTSYPRPFAFMGGNARKVDSQELVGLEATAVMGGVEADLTGARARGREVVAEVFAWWGGIELIVPENWQVVSEVTPVMGGVEDSTRFAGGESAATLVVRGLVVMGGVEIKNAKGRRGEFRGVKVGISHVGSRGRKEVRVDQSGVTIVREDAPPPPPPVS